MSLLDFILEQRLVLISIGAVLVPLMIALALWFVANLRKAAVRRARNRVREQEQRAVEMAEHASSLDEEQEYSAPVRSRSAKAAPHAGVERAPSVPHQAKAVPAAQVIQPTAENRPAETQGNAVASGMQDLLTSVFSDEEKSARYAVLLRGLDYVNASDLAALCTQIADGLRACQPDTLTE